MASEIDHMPLHGGRLLLMNIALAMGTLLFVLDYSIANVAIPYIAGGLAVSTDQGTYVITAFAVGNGIALAISGWLAERLGSVRLVIISIITFIFFSWTCG